MIELKCPNSIPKAMLEIGSEFKVPLPVQNETEPIARASVSLNKNLKFSKQSSTQLKCKISKFKLLYRSQA